MEQSYFPLRFRPRRLRKNEAIRSMVRETKLSKDELIMPVFVKAGTNIKHEIPSMPGIYQWSLDRVHEELDELVNLGLNAIILFGLPAEKDATGSDSGSDACSAKVSGSGSLTTPTVSSPLQSQ